MALFIIANIIFLALCLWLILTEAAWWVWALVIALWFATDAWFARGLELAWWHWALLIIALCAVDLFALRILGQI